MRSRLRAVLLSVLGAAPCCFAVPARAQQPAGSDQPEPWRISFAPRGEYAFSSDLRTSGSSVSIARAGLGLDVSGPLGDRSRLLLAADFESSFYRFKDVSLLPFASEPLTDAYTIRLRPGIAYRLDDEWTLVGGAIVEFAGESGADVGDSLTYGGYGGASYRVSEDLSLTFGLTVKTRLEDDAFVAPLLGVRWKINEQFSLNTEGLGVRLSAKLSDEFTASVFGRYELRDFRLDDDSPISGGIVQDARLPIGATLEWSPTSRVRIALSGGAIVAQKFHFLNRNGDEIAEDRTRPAPFIGLRGEFSF